MRLILSGLIGSRFRVPGSKVATQHTAIDDIRVGLNAIKTEFQLIKTNWWFFNPEPVNGYDKPIHNTGFGRIANKSAPTIQGQNQRIVCRLVI
jgi:hypothetical protein